MAYDPYRSSRSQPQQQGGRLVIDLGRLGSPLSIVLIGIGLVAIALGANGIRSNDTVIEQMPYLLTGGLVGIAFVIFGSAYMVVQNFRQDRVRLEAKLDELLDALVAGAAIPARGGMPTGATPAPGDLSGLVVAGNASYHVPGCRLVDGREEVSYLTPAEARERQLKPCRVCQPAAEPTNVTIR